jgi:hypothetical protein
MLRGALNQQGETFLIDAFDARPESSTNIHCASDLILQIAPEK